jgi:hypothetical protein
MEFRSEVPQRFLRDDGKTARMSHFAGDSLFDNGSHLLPDFSLGVHRYADRSNRSFA